MMKMLLEASIAADSQAGIVSFVNNERIRKK